MDRTNGANNINVGGKRKFTDGPPGTCVEEGFLNGVQEEIMAVIEGAGLVPDANVNTQLRDSIFATVSGGGFFNVPAIGLSIGSGGLGAYTSGGNSVMDGEYHFTDFTLQSAHQLSVGSTGILIIRCTGTATINGSVNGAGTVGASGSTAGLPYGSGGHGGGGGGAGGYGAGGSGGIPLSVNYAGNAGGFWSAGSGTNNGGTAGSGKTNPLLLRFHAGIMGGSGGSNLGSCGQPGGSLVNVTEWTICNFISMNVLFGGGGGGGGSPTAGLGGPSGGGGGGGGSFILIVAPSILGAGSVNSNGGYGGSSTSGAGGGGGGGGVAITVSKNTPSISISAVGGSAGSGSFVGSAGSNGFGKSYHP